MSEFGDIETAILAVVTAAVSGVTTNQGLQNYNDIPADKYPYAMTADPNEDVERLDLRQNRKTVIVGVHVVYHGSTAAAVSTDLDAIRDGIDADPTLGGIAIDSWVSTRARVDLIPDNRIVALLEIATMSVD